MGGFRRVCFKICCASRFFQYFAPRFAEVLKHIFVGRWSQFFIHVYVTFVFIS